ncbi:MAG: hypothetical protein J6S75_07145 [Thermoguttaceae bacterium]|nr:hypothetical protein [Thermoguttaceae bacterium]
MPESTDIIYLSDILLPRDPQTQYHAATKGYVDTGLSGKAASSHTHAAGEVTGLGTAALANTGTHQGNVPVLSANGKLPESVLPALAVTDIFTCADEEEMLSSPAQKGDIAIRTDVSKTFILTQNVPESLASWRELPSPSGAVQSVNGQTGAVVIDTLPAGGNAGDVLVRQGSGSAWRGRRYSGTITGDGVTSVFTVTHGLGELAVQVDLFQVNQDQSLTQVKADVVLTSDSAIQVRFAAAPDNGAGFRVICRI